jgi:hypothetical protein
MSQQLTTIERLYKPLAIFSLLLFIAMATIHVMALAHWVVIPVAIVLPLGSLVFVSHVVLVGGCVGDRACARVVERSQQLRMWDLTKAIPWQWKLPVAILLYIYAPWVVIRKAIETRAHGTGDDAAVLFLSLVFMLFALFHFLCLWFALPRKEEILSARNASGRR